ncbi:DUF1254 domain-containing protein [Falsiroseomonas sp. HW251]|uniref:DUF1254 domain-containing protein n=1 Tax=Falsiroseomonas sp. HW251 TaxID=3390998 RepID=UPI003D31E690
MAATRRLALTGTSLLLSTAALIRTPALAQSDVPASLSGPHSEDELAAIAADAYVYAYSLLSVEMSRRVITNVERAETTRAPMGQFAKLREYPTAAYRDVTAPNADTLYANAFVNVGEEPWVLSWPDMGDRYYVWNIYNAWVPVTEAPGSRTTGQKAQAYAITGPNWRGTLPDGVGRIICPTATAWILGRVYSSGTPADFRAVWALQDQFRLVPLSSYGRSYTPPPGRVDPNIDMRRSVRDSVNALDGPAFFSLTAELMTTNPPAPEDGPMLLKLEKLGILPGRSLEVASIPPPVARAMERGRRAGWERIAAHTREAGTPGNGWIINPANYGFATDYLARAWLCAFGIPANQPRDAVYPYTMLDRNNRPLDGRNKYVIRFPSRADLPPANGFWSLTMYDEGWFFVPNPLNRYTVSERNQLKANTDGSIDLHVQKDSPGADRESNWLPAPEGRFILCMRLYWPVEPPNRSVLNLTWLPPFVDRVG